MLLRRCALTIFVTGMVLVIVGPAQAAQASKPSSDVRIQARICVPCAVGGAALVVRVARAVKAARAAKKLRAAGRRLKASANQGVKITKKRAEEVRKQAAVVVKRGKPWVKRNWETLAPYVRVCFQGIIAAEAYEEFKDGVTLVEWKEFMRSPLSGLGQLGGVTFLDDGYDDLYNAKEFDFKKRVDLHIASCATSMTAKGLFA